MTSDKQVQANRRNALKSTGPKTPQGKDAVRLNANKHGLRSQEVLLPGEDEEALKELDENLRAELQPVGELENLLVDRIISDHCCSLETTPSRPGRSWHIRPGAL